MTNFTLEMAAGITQQWHKGRQIQMDEALYAIHNPKVYLNLANKEDYNQLKDQISIWQNMVNGPKKPLSALPKKP